jgi:hypothetical protein
MRRIALTLSMIAFVGACSPQEQRDAGAETKETLDTVQTEGSEAAAEARSAASEIGNDPDVRAAAGTARDAAALAAAKLGEAAVDAAGEIRDSGDASDQDKPNP